MGDSTEPAPPAIAQGGWKLSQHLHLRLLPSVLLFERLSPTPTHPFSVCFTSPTPTLCSASLYVFLLLWFWEGGFGRGIVASTYLAFKLCTLAKRLTSYILLQTVPLSIPLWSASSCVPTPIVSLAHTSVPTIALESHSRLSVRAFIEHTYRTGVKY